jgi:hypothetical protein
VRLVPRVGGAWAAVKTLALGVVQEPVVPRQGEQEIHTTELSSFSTTELSSFSRLTDHETFGPLARVETHRRGTQTAGVVCAVGAGAEGEHGFIALHCPAAVCGAPPGLGPRAGVPGGGGPSGLWGGHRAGWGGHRAGRAVAGPAAQQRHALTHDDPQTVLAALRARRAEGAAEQGADAAPGGVSTHPLEDLAKRRAQIQYATFAVQG